MSDEIPEPDWESLTPDPAIDETPVDIREAFATPDFRAHGRARRNLWGQRDKESATGRTPRQRTIKQKSTIPNRKGQFVEPVTRAYVMIGGVIAIRDPHCGRVIVMQAEAAAVALDDLAYTDEFTRRILWSLTQTGKYGAVIGAHLPILIAVLIHHVPAISDAISYMGQAFAESVIRGEAMSNGETPDSGPAAEH